MSLGLKQAGLRVERAYDFWEPALAIHEANLPDFLGKLTGAKKTRRRNLGAIDISLLKQIAEANDKGATGALIELVEELEAVGDILSLIPEVVGLAPNMIVGGPPCQPWSQVGRRLGDNDPQARLTIAFSTIVCAVRPKYFIMENVKQIRKSRTFKQAVMMFKKSGYGLTDVVLNAAFYGVPQSRERLLLIGCLGEGDKWLHDHLEAARSETEMTVADVLGPDFGKPHYRKKLSKGRTVWRAANARTSDEKVNFYWLEPPWRRKDAGSRRTDAPMKTISRGVLARPSANYPVKLKDVENVYSLPVPTFEQLAQLGGFPATWDWSAVPDQATRMRILANAVPPPLAAAIGRCILGHHKGERPTVQSDAKVPSAFVDWLKNEKSLEGPRLSQVISEFKAVQRLFGSRTFESYAGCLDFLETIPAFKMLGASRKSNLRRVVRLFQECDEQSLWEEAQRNAPIRWSGLRRLGGMTRGGIVPDTIDPIAAPAHKQETSAD